MIEDTNFDQEPFAMKMKKKSAEKSAESAEKSANSKTCKDLDYQKDVSRFG